MKITKAISINKEINEILIELQKEGFNFSKWVSEKVLEEFQNINKINEEIELKKKEIEKLENKKKEINKRKTQIFSELNENQIKFLKTIPNKIKNGAEKDKICKCFNNLYGKDYSTRKIMELARYYDEN